MKRTISFILTCGVMLTGCDASAQLTTRQMRTSGTPYAVPQTTASNGVSDSVARVDHTHTCTTASASVPGCLSAADWSTFNGKEVPLSFSGGLTRVVNTVTCDDASGSANGCVTTAAQNYAGIKTFFDGVVSSSVAAEADEALVLVSDGGAVSLASGTDKFSAPHPINFTPADGTIGLLEVLQLYAPAVSPHTLAINVTSSSKGESTVAIRNANWTAETPDFTTDLDIEHGDLEVCSKTRIACDGTGTFTSIASGNWGSHGHTDATSGGTLSASAIGSGTLAVARGGTGVSTATSDAVLVGNGSAWQAKVIPDCDAAGSRLRYDTTGNTFSCAKLNAWSTITSFTNGWDDCTSAPRYRKDADGQVHLSGCIMSGTVGSAATTLATGYRPAANRGFAVATGVGAPATCYLLISSAGVITPRGGCSNAAVYLDGVSFFTD